MTTEPRPTADQTRRKFDDVASLYGSAGAGAGATSPFPRHRPAFIPLPPTYTAPVKRVEPPQEAPPAPTNLAGAMPKPEILEGVRISTTQAAPAKPPAASAPANTPPRVDPPPVSRPRVRPAEIPWPDAFEPRPNYRKREGRTWSWLLLIPAGLVAGAAITMVDARAVRSWIDVKILHRTTVAGTLDSPLLPPAFRAAPAATVAAPAVADATQPVDVPNVTPALPTSPLPVPPGTEVSPPPPDPSNPVVSAPARVIIQFRRNIPGADGEARRLAALLQSFGGSVELHPNASTVRVPTINYYNAADKDTAAALATALTNEAPNWTVRLGTAKNPPGTLDVWLP